MTEFIVKRNNRLLIVDDNRAIHSDFRKILRPETKPELGQLETDLFDTPAAAERPVYELDSAYQGQEALELVKKARAAELPYAMAFVDVRMPPGWDGVETISRIWAVDPDIQVVLCTAYSDYTWDDILAKLAHPDRLLILKKPFDPAEVMQLAAALTEKYRLLQEVGLKMNWLESKVDQRTRVLQETNETLQSQIQERQRTAEALRQSEERYQLLFRENPFPMYVVDLQTRRFLAVNQAAVDVYGFKAAEWLGRTLADLHCPEDLPLLRERYAPGNTPKPAAALPANHRKKDGGVVTVELSSRFILFDGCEAELVLANDVTERKKLEAQFLRAQRIESIGTLATGMAHDLNNILAPILISASAMRWGLGPEEQAKAISRIELSVKRGADIIQQVLTFGRGMNGDRSAVNAGDVLDEVAKIAERTFPKAVAVHSEIERGLWAVTGDRTQIHQILLNLSVNARDAMPEGGTLEMSARNIVLTESKPGLPAPVGPGNFVLLQVSDTGSGIPVEVRDRIFDPFFTTKEIGKGTGLGLSTVLGIVKSHRGAISVESNPGCGTIFRILLPAAPRPALDAGVPAPAVLPKGGGETILIVDDEPEIVAGIKVILENQNYRVLTARNGREALDAAGRHRGDIHLVLTDMMMPEMDGPAAIREFKRLHPGMRIIASSGQTGLVAGNGGGNDPATLGADAFLAKPYSPDALFGTLSRLLDKSALAPALAAQN